MSELASTDKAKYKILVSAPLDFLPELKQTITDEMSLVYAPEVNRAEIERLLVENDFAAWLVAPRPTYSIDREIIDLCPSLKIISTPSTGSDHLDLDYIKFRDIGFFSLKEADIVKEIFASSEFTFNLMISTIRNTPYAFRAACEGKWRTSLTVLRGRELNGLTLGIIGFGRIGSNLSRYALAFGMKVIIYDPYKKSDNPEIIQENSLDNLLAAADVISVSVHLNKKTYKMINDSVFGKMKNGVYFINTSRGDVVDEPALLRNLISGKIKAAGLDVIGNELTEDNDKKDHSLIQYARRHQNLIITPHIAGLTFDSEKKAQTAAYRAVRKFLFEGNRI